MKLHTDVCLFDGLAAIDLTFINWNLWTCGGLILVYYSDLLKSLSGMSLKQIMENGSLQ